MGGTIGIMAARPLKIEISAKTIVFTVIFLIFLQILWIVRGLIISLFLAFMIMSLVKPIVNRLARLKIPRMIGALFVFALLIGGIGAAFYNLVPLLVADMSVFIHNLTRLIQSTPYLDQYTNADSLTRYLPNITNRAFSILSDIFSNIVFVITTLFFAFYFVVQKESIASITQRFLDPKQSEIVIRIFDRAERRMGNWFWGELVLMTAIGTLTYIGLTILGVRNALTLAFIAGLLEVVPIIGPVMSAIPAFIFSVNQTYFLGISVLALYLIIQQLENNLLVPIVMKQAVGLNKIIILMVLIIGGKLGGISGVFLAIPITICVETIFVELMGTDSANSSVKTISSQTSQSK